VLSQHVSARMRHPQGIIHHILGAETCRDNLVDDMSYFNCAFVGKMNKCDTKTQGVDHCKIVICYRILI
jgi:hypothetical protein